MHIMFFDGINEFVLGGIDAEIVHDKTGAAQHHDAQVFSDIVQVALDSAHNRDADRFDTGGRKNWLDMRHAGFHRPSTGEDLGYEDKVFTELDADDSHASDQAVVHDLGGLDVVGKGLGSQVVDGLVVAVNEGRGDVLHLFASVHKKVDDAFDFVGPLNKFFDLVADEFVGDVF